MSPKPSPCNESEADMAQLVEEILTQQNRGWMVYPHTGGGHHVQLLIALIDEQKLADIRQSLEFWGFTRGDSDEVESWFYSKPWRNPCR